MDSYFYVNDLQKIASVKKICVWFILMKCYTITWESEPGVHILNVDSKVTFAYSSRLNIMFQQKCGRLIIIRENNWSCKLNVWLHLISKSRSGVTHFSECWFRPHFLRVKKLTKYQINIDLFEQLQEKKPPALYLWSVYVKEKWKKFRRNRKIFTFLHKLLLRVW